MAQEVLEEAHKEIPRLLHLIFQDKETQGHGDLEASELSIRHAMHQLGGVLMEKRINADQGDHRGARIAWGAGHEAECRADRPKHVTTVFSEMGINRAYDDCSSCHRGILPKDTDWDMEHTSFSPGVRRMMARGGANESFEDGRRDWDELAGVPGTAREVGGVAEAMGAQVQTVADRERVHVMAGPLLPLVPPVPILYIAMDGTPACLWCLPRRQDGRANEQRSPRHAKPTWARCVLKPPALRRGLRCVRRPPQPLGGVLRPLKRSAPG
jgi:hypothetical protein